MYDNTSGMWEGRIIPSRLAQSFLGFKVPLLQQWSLWTSIGFSSRYCSFAKHFCLVNSVKKQGKKIPLRAELALPTTQELSFKFVCSLFGVWMKSDNDKNFTEKIYLWSETNFNKTTYLKNSRMCSLKSLHLFFLFPWVRGWESSFLLA